jgi:hypothetical protein
LNTVLALRWWSVKATMRDLARVSAVRRLNAVIALRPGVRRKSADGTRTAIGGDIRGPALYRTADIEAFSGNLDSQQIRPLRPCPDSFALPRDRRQLTDDLFQPASSVMVCNSPRSRG